MVTIQTAPYPQYSKSKSKSPPRKVSVLLIGNSSVGKSSLVARLCGHDWRDNSQTPTIGLKYCSATTLIDGKPVKDSPGMEKLRTVTRQIYRDAHGIMLVYDIGNLGSFAMLPDWNNEIEFHAGEKLQIKMVVGNKTDNARSRRISRQEAEKFASENGCLFTEVSAKTNAGVSEALQRLVENIVRSPRLNTSTSDTNVVEIGRQTGRTDSSPSPARQCSC